MHAKNREFHRSVQDDDAADQESIVGTNQFCSVAAAPS
jgi:hypothetical protein